MGVAKIWDGTTWQALHGLALGAAPVLSTARPAGPVQGQTIYETDTTRVMMWDGDSWECIAHLGPWLTYTPVWTNAGSGSVNPSVGNGSLVGRYTQVGKTVTVVIVLTAGSTTNYGTGNFRFSLPTPAKYGNFIVGSAVSTSPVGAYNVRGAIDVNPESDLILYPHNSANQLGTSNSGFTASTILRIETAYEAA